jgi:hypothetical protein
MRRLLCALLIPCFLIASSGALAAAPDIQTEEGQVQENHRDGMIVLEGREIFHPKESLLMRELGQEHSHTSRARRFEIVFFITLPVTLLLSFSLMEGLSRNVPDFLNPNFELKRPHYIYMFSTSVITSLLVAIDDVRRYHPPQKTPFTEVSERRFELPIVGVRF